MSRRGSRPAAHALCPPTTPVRCGCALAAPAHAARSWSTNEADLSGARLPSSGSASRLPRRFTGLSITMASPVSSDPLAELSSSVREKDAPTHWQEHLIDNLVQHKLRKGAARF